MAFTFFLFERASIDDKKPSAVSLKPSEVSVLIPPLTSCDEESSSKMEVDSESRMRVRKTAMTAKTKKFVLIIIMLILSVMIIVERNYTCLMSFTEERLVMIIIRE